MAYKKWESPFPKKLLFRIILTSVVSLCFSIIVSPLISASGLETGYVSDILSFIAMVQTASASSSTSPSLFQFPLEEGEVDNPRERISESTKWKGVQGNDFQISDLIEHKTPKSHKAQNVEQLKEKDVIIKKVIPKISKAKENKQFRHLASGQSIITEVTSGDGRDLNMGQQKKLLPDIKKNKGTDVRKLVACENDYKKKNYCIEETEHNTCNLIGHIHSKNSFICSSQTNKIKVTNLRPVEERMLKPPNLQVNQTLELQDSHQPFVDIGMSSDGPVITEDQTDSNTNKNQLRPIQSKISKILVSATGFASNNSEGVVHNNNDNVNANFSIWKSNIQLIKNDLSPQNSSKLIANSEDDELGLDCTPNGIKLVTKNKGSIICTVHNSGYSAHEVKLKCVGLEGTGINCYINGAPNADKIIVEASSVKSFQVAAIIPPIPNLVQGLYPFTIRAN